MLSCKRFIAVMFASVMVCGLAMADDWAQWRGPNRDGISQETGWYHGNQVAVLWKQQVGLGYSSFSVADGKVYTTGYDIEAKEDVVYCLNAETGDVVWTYQYPAKRWKKAHAGGTNTTPTISEGKVYVLNRDGNFYSFNAMNGDVIWHHQLVEDFGAVLPSWGFACSPVVLGDEVIVDVGMVMSFNKHDGKVLWKSHKYPAGYATPTPFERNGIKCLALFNAEGVVVIDRESRRELTGYPWKTSYDVNPATPIVTEELVFISSGYGVGGGLLKMDKSKMTLVWKNELLRTRVNTATLIDGYLYAIDEKAGLRCVDFKTGELKWEEKSIGNGAMSVADGKLLVLSNKGDFVVAEVSPEGFKPLARKDVLSGGVFWTVPVLSNGRIYCRSSEGNMVCLKMEQ